MIDPPPATIDPAVGGFWRWQDSNALRFVPSGGFTTSTTDVEIYNPASNTWSMGPSTLFPVRNYAKGYGLNEVISQSHRQIFQRT